MKAKRIFSAIIALAMIIASMGTVALAADDTIILPAGITADSFGDSTVTDGTNYWATLQAAVEAIDAAKTSGASLYCKPGSNVGTMKHAPVCSTLTIYGNGASVAEEVAGEAFDIGNVDSNYDADITTDMTFTVKNLNGWGAWGTKATDYTVDLVFENCSDMGKVFINGTTGTLNIALTSCSFNDNAEADGCAFYSNADGTFTTDVSAYLAGGYEIQAGDDGEFAVIEGKWTTDTDACYYLVGETKTGLMRFLFAYDIDADKVAKSGIKYLKSSNITDFVTSQENVEGSAPAFYGDITGIEEAEYTETYYAVAYLETTDGEVFWSEAVGCTPNFENHFKNYTVEVAE